jgi:hypothetical protein
LHYFICLTVFCVRTTLLIQEGTIYFHSMGWRRCSIKSRMQMGGQARHQWFTPIILATQETEIRRIAVQSQCRK